MLLFVMDTAAITGSAATSAPSGSGFSADAGATAVMLSNHGGRQLDFSPAPFDVLREVADIELGEGPAQISREDGRRRLVVELNVVDRDIGGFVEEAAAP